MATDKNKMTRPKGLRIPWMSHWRYGVVMSSVFLAVAVLSWRLVDLHVIDREFLRTQGDARTVRVESIDAHRGMITDRNGEALAISTPVQTLWVNPGEVDPDDSRIGVMAHTLGINPAAFRKRLKSNSERQFMFLKRKVQPSVAREVLALKIPGIYAKREYKRYYPAGEVAAHVIGFVNIDERGQEGIELAYNGWLSGEVGRKRVLRDNRGRLVKDLSLIADAAPGKDLQLSIDLRLQYLAYRELKAAVHAHNASGGSLAMLDVHTGEILAMVNQTSYNPNNRSEIDPRDIRNRAITDLFEPGSTVKPLTIAAALESGRYRPDTIINTSPGYLRLNGYTIRDARDYGRLSLSEVIYHSSNIGTSKIAMDLTGPVLEEMFSRMGFGQSTAVGFPGESIGVMPIRTRWKDIELATFSYGYGLSVNALQLAQAYMVLANGGVRYPLSLLALKEPPEGQRVISADITAQVREMLRKVVEKGTGKRADMAIYSSAGKTGTVHLVGDQGYQDSRYKSIFAGMAPADNPRIVSVITVDDPKGNEYYGGEVAAPIFARVMGDALRLLNVKPNIEPTLARQADDGSDGSG
jgi:cell division protein FtsI (penicillin-binding protein 3)